MTAKTCHERALGLLAVRPRTCSELRQRLNRAGFETAEVEDVLTRLEGVGLIDDQAFAERLAEQRFGSKHSGSRAVASELRAKGVSSDIVDGVVGPEVGQDEARAEELAARALRRMAGVDPQKAFRRVNSLLLRRGYGYDIARRATLSALEIAVAGDADLA